MCERLQGSGVSVLRSVCVSVDGDLRASAGQCGVHEHELGPVRGGVVRDHLRGRSQRRPAVQGLSAERSRRPLSGRVVSDDRILPRSMRTM